MAQFAAGVADTGGKFAAGVVDTLTCDYLHEFSKKFETVLMQYSGAGEKLIHQKNQKQKISWHCPFKLPTLVETVRKKKEAVHRLHQVQHF